MDGDGERAGRSGGRRRRFLALPRLPPTRNNRGLCEDTRPKNKLASHFHHTHSPRSVILPPDPDQPARCDGHRRRRHSKQHKAAAGQTSRNKQTQAAPHRLTSPILPGQEAGNLPSFPIFLDVTIPLFACLGPRGQCYVMQVHACCLPRRRR